MKSMMHVATIGLVLLLAACAGVGPKTEGDVGQTLEQRAVARWQLLIAGDFDQAYSYLTPGFRQTMSLEQYKATSRHASIKWTGITWRGADCASPESCEARLSLDYEFRMPSAGMIPSISLEKEKWLLIDGVWYLLPGKT